MKKIIRCALIVSCLYTAGCYNTVSLSREEATGFSAKNDIVLFMGDGKMYEFKAGEYEIYGDSLRGTGFGVRKPASGASDERFKFKGSIPFANIVSIRTKELNAAKTILAVGGVVTFGLVMLMVLGLGSMWR